MTEAAIQDGWNAFSYSDLVEVLTGSDRLTGYYNYEKAKSLSDFGLEHPYQSIDLTYEPSEFLEELAKRRLDHYEYLRMVIYNEELGYRTIPVTVRGQDRYRKRIERQLELLHDFMYENRLSALHARFSPRAEIGKSPLDSLIEMKEFLNKFLSYVQSVLGYRPFYLWAIEPTRRGHCHYHIIFIGIKWLMPKEQLDQWFVKQGYGGPSGVYLETMRADVRARRGKDLSKLLNYLIEYIGKPTQDLKWQGLLTLTRKREWGMSTKLRQILLAYEERRRFTCIQGETNSNYPTEWIFIGILTETEIEVLIGDKNPPPDQLISDLMDIRGTVRRMTHPSYGL